MLTAANVPLSVNFVFVVWASARVFACLELRSISLQIRPNYSQCVEVLRSWVFSRRCSFRFVLAVDNTIAKDLGYLHLLGHTMSHARRILWGCGFRCDVDVSSRSFPKCRRAFNGWKSAILGTPERQFLSEAVLAVCVALVSPVQRLRYHVDRFVVQLIVPFCDLILLPDLVGWPTLCEASR